MRSAHTAFPLTQCKGRSVVYVLPKKWEISPSGAMRCPRTASFSSSPNTFVGRHTHRLAIRTGDFTNGAVTASHAGLLIRCIAGGAIPCGSIVQTVVYRLRARVGSPGV